MSQLGIVTYNIAKDWDLPTILSRLEKLGYEGVELRTAHAHKVEVNLTKAERDLVRKRFEDSPVQLAGQCLRLLELKPVRRQEGLDQADIRLGRVQGPRSSPTRPHR
jgi:sugar phosphate isomerase/epimerase